MLTLEQKQLIKQTAPVVAEHGRHITEVFYPMLFSRYPEVKSLFNQTNQVIGRQREALANAVIAYAANIDRLEVLTSVVETITHKHASLNILPEYYPLVGECLLDAIKEVLGEAASDELIAAWAAAFQQLADLLIGGEKEIYSEHQRQSGWQGFKPFTVTKKIAESDVISSFYLTSPEGLRNINFKAGQYIGVRTKINGETVVRNYSMSDAPGKDYVRISVKREAGGMFSSFLHDSVNEGDTLWLSPPSGNFTLRQNKKPLVLITGGVGLTPAISMLNDAVGSDRPITFIHAALNSQTHAFKQHVDELVASHDNVNRFYIYDRPTDACAPDATGFIDQALIAELLPDDKQADVYFLGPTPFMRNVNKALQAIGVANDSIFYEFFGPASTLND